MLYSQNGYAAKDFALIATYTIPSTSVRISLRKGDVSVVLLYVAQQFNNRVQSLRSSDTGGYNPRAIRAGVSLSNHASGTAIDLRWNDHPLGKVGTFTQAQVNTIHAILRECEGVVRWGGDYHGRKDEMHFEIVGSPSAVTAVANKIRGGNVKKESTPASSSSGTLKEGMKNNARVRKLQTGLNHSFPRYSKLSVDGDFGPKTTSVVKEFQRRTNLTADGIVGPKTTAKLNSFGIRF